MLLSDPFGSLQLHTLLRLYILYSIVRLVKKETVLRLKGQEKSLSYLEVSLVVGNVTC